ncbi:MAG: hypothetical protein ABI743_04990, partial [bacterium]
SSVKTEGLSMATRPWTLALLPLLGILSLAPAAHASGQMGGCWIDSSVPLNATGLSTDQVYAYYPDPVLDDRYIQEAVKIRSLFGVSPEIWFYDDSDGDNAFATDGQLDQDPANPDGAVFFGVNLLQHQANDASANGTDWAVPAILAHEFTHIAQSANGVTIDGRLRELHADFVAGWYIAQRRQQDYGATNPITSLKHFFAIGDYEFSDPDHHGTPHERLDAVAAGMIAGEDHATFSDAFWGGIDYVKEIPVVVPAYEPTYDDSPYTDPTYTDPTYTDPNPYSDPPAATTDWNTQRFNWFSHFDKFNDASYRSDVTARLGEPSLTEAMTNGNTALTYSDPISGAVGFAVSVNASNNQLDGILLGPLDSSGLRASKTWFALMGFTDELVSVLGWSQSQLIAAFGPIDEVTEQGELVFTYTDTAGSHRVMCEMANDTCYSVVIGWH